jgi:DnaJ-class molecular chaperone
MARCSPCDGSGTVNCPRCGGTGEKIVYHVFTDAEHFECSLCHGSGVKQCGACNGSGYR